MQRAVNVQGINPAACQAPPCWLPLSAPAGSGPFLWTVKPLSSFPVWHLTSLGKRLMNWLAFNRFYEARQEHASTDRILNAFSREASHACFVSVQPVCVCRHEGLRGNHWLRMASKGENYNKSNMWPLAYCLTSDEPSLKLLWACWFHTNSRHTHCEDDRRIYSHDGNIWFREWGI